MTVDLQSLSDNSDRSSRHLTIFSSKDWTMDSGRGPGKDYKGMDAGPEDVPALLKCIGIDWNIRDRRDWNGQYQI